MSESVTAQDRAKLAEDIELAILKAIDQAGFRNGAAVESTHTAAKLVVNRVTERKKVKA